MTEEKELKNENKITEGIMKNKKLKQIVENEKLKKVLENKIFTFPKLYLSTIDNGSFFRKPFSFLYGLIAILNIYIPIHIIIMAIDNNIFNAPFKFVLVFLLLLFAIILASFFGFHIWWDRNDKIGISSEQHDFIATHVFSNLIQTTGEFIGTWIGLVGFTLSLSAWIFLSGQEGSQLSRMMGIPLSDFGIAGVMIMPIIGYLIIILSKFLSEQFKALAAIANNTSKNNSQ
ncbi:MAG: hypothetical protein HQK65_22670 [Desulfamplus sp.]|nr:hypothetical protein [Desulfamplus sp.]